MRSMQFQLDDCILRGWQGGDEPSLARHANDREIWLNLRDRFPHPYSLADAEEWVRFASAQQPRVNFAIEVAGEAVGGISLMLQEDVERVSAEVGYWLGRSFWGRGIGNQRAAGDHGTRDDDVRAHQDLCPPLREEPLLAARAGEGRIPPGGGASSQCPEGWHCPGSGTLRIYRSGRARSHLTGGVRPVRQDAGRVGLWRSETTGRWGFGGCAATLLRAVVVAEKLPIRAKPSAQWEHHACGPWRARRATQRDR
jgi:hypothetical protein